MGLFTTSKKEHEEIRGIPTENLPRLTDQQLIMLALVQLFAAQGFDDDEDLVNEMYRRIKK
jgi:hypothetical protein